MSIHTNLPSIASQRRLSETQDALSVAVARIASGLRVRAARDDAAGLAISDRFTAQIRGLDQAVRNANDAISLTQTAEGSLASMSDHLQRVRELAVQAANPTNTASDRAATQAEVRQLLDEVDRLARQATFNGARLLDGSFTARDFQVGANLDEKIRVAALGNMRTRELGSQYGLSLRDHSIGDAGSWADTMVITIDGVDTVLLGLIHDAKAIAAAVNGAHVPGLTLRANATSVAAGSSTATATGSGTASLSINGVAIAIAGQAGGGALAANRAAAVSAINAQYGMTGVQAVDTGSGVALSAADGRNIATAYSAGTFAGSSAADFGLRPDAVTAATIDWEYVGKQGVSSTLTYIHWHGGYMPQTYAIPPPGTALGSVDVSTGGGASAALASVDRALQTVSTARAALGALQNRLGSTIGTLQTSGENFSAARSRIVDADFASETATLTRAQILQSSGTAMVAQANQLPGQVLRLLR